jgi:Uma2 family endonuclease
MASLERRARAGDRDSALNGGFCMAMDLNKTERKSLRRRAEPEPAWEIARLFPAQGYWSEEDYFVLDTNRLVELSDGFIEVLSMPTMEHQLIVMFLADAIRQFANSFTPKRGTTLVAPIPVRLWENTYREPDVVFMMAEHAARMTNDFWDRADLVVEVVSDKNRRHDINKKRREYAKARVPEYWIVDPGEGTITILFLKPRQKTYTKLRTFPQGTRAVSRLLDGFSVDVTAALSQRP